MKKVGMIVAVEMSAVQKKYGVPTEVLSVCRQQVLRYHTDRYDLYIMRSGAGEIRAAAATQLLISKFDVEVIVNFGVVGGLTEEISGHRICVVKSVVHYEFDTSAVDHVEVGRYLEYPTVYLPLNEELLKLATEKVPSLKQVVCASANKFVADVKGKEELHTKFHADICEMEAAGIVLTCDRNEVPCLLIKMVADGINGGADEFTKEFDNSSNVCLDILDAIMTAW